MTRMPVRRRRPLHADSARDQAEGVAAAESAEGFGVPLLAGHFLGGVGDVGAVVAAEALEDDRVVHAGDPAELAGVIGIGRARRPSRPTLRIIGAGEMLQFVGGAAADLRHPSRCRRF